MVIFPTATNTFKLQWLRPGRLIGGWLVGWRAVPRAHVDGRVDDALVGDLQRPLDLPVHEVTDGPRARRCYALLREVPSQRELRWRYLA